MNSKLLLLRYSEQYRCVLREYLDGHEEAALQKAYKLGRTAASQGVGVLDLAAAHHEALELLLRPETNLETRTGILQSAATLLAESLSPYEMTHRSFQEANDSLLKLNAELEQRVHERTRELEALNRELMDFAHVVSHDLKAPLAGIVSIIDVIQEEYTGVVDDEGRELLKLLSSRSERMRNLIEGILQYSRAGRVSEDKLEVNLNLLVQDITQMLAPPANVQILIINTLPTLHCEKTRMQQVFQNLLGNSIKSIDKPEGKITLSCEEEPNYYLFAVQDNGRGIQQQQYQRIFQLFVVLNPVDVNSTGVGLTVVKKIVELYGGRIWVESDVGKGTTFYFTLPK